MTLRDERGPADRIIDRYCPDLDPADRELAMERLRSLARVLAKISRRHATESPGSRFDSIGSEG